MVVALVIFCALLERAAGLWSRVRPRFRDTGWPPRRPVTEKAAAARPEGQLVYPGATLAGHLGGDERTQGFGQTAGAAGAILLTEDSADQVRAWYQAWLLARGWRLVASGRGSNGIALARDQYRRGPREGRENFTLSIDDPARLAWVTGNRPLQAATVFEVRYSVAPYAGAD
ncbi:MAG TPA: hypothetical protein VNM16_02125 [Bacillota bacterium]|nr:hypothetical protein [Bacillota bacterium]